MEIQFNEDGTLRASTHPGEFRFEGTRLIFNSNPAGACFQLGAETGIYEVNLLENGNLKFTVIEDDCLVRVSYTAGRVIEVEFEPVP